MMTKDEAISLVLLAQDAYFTDHPRAKRFNGKKLAKYLCIHSQQEICEALGATCSEGKTDPDECIGVFMDAVDKAMIIVDEVHRAHMN